MSNEAEILDAGLDAALLEALAVRAGRPDFARFRAQLRSSGYCARPIRLQGTVRDGEGRLVWSTDGEPDGILRQARRNRREAICPPCSQTYGNDAYHLILSGLMGGKGVPDTVAQHPAVFLTLTAPSFGVAHTRRYGADGEPLRCRPRRNAQVCPHGVRLSCGAIHDEDDPCLGQALCADCFDHEGAVVWNNMISELWRRTSIYLPRALARIAGLTHKQLRAQVRPAYVKVAEYQQRGLVHLHVVIRLDRAMPAYRNTEIKPPPLRYDTEILEQAIRAAIIDVAAPLPEELGGGRIRWGDELDIRHFTGEKRGRTAGYLAKYSTKSTELAGGVLHRIREADIDRLNVNEHVRGYLRAAFDLHHQAGPDRRFGRYAHTFGYRGHCLTKSRRYSTTFKALRQARQDHVHDQLLKRHAIPESQRQLAQLDPNDRVSRFRYAGQGHLTTADALLAQSAHTRALENRRLAWEERRHASSAVTTDTDGPYVQEAA